MNLCKLAPYQKGVKRPKSHTNTSKRDPKHLARVAALGCIVCRNNGLEGTPANAHHINCKTMGRKAGDYETIPLCPTHHQYSGHGEIAVHDGLESFEARYGTERELLMQTLALLQGEEI